LLKQSLETLVHWFNQDWTAILGTPHPMIFEAEYGLKVTVPCGRIYGM
jgi:hypothetical protein